MKSRLIALSLALLCLLSLAAPAARAEEAEPERVTVHIASAADLRKLASDCAFDTWSDNVDVLLDRDINLRGEGFTPIPIFNGRFDGQGHAIRGMEPTSDGSNQGLFRFLREQAVVENLRVSGALAPEVGREYVGGIAGVNAGKLVNCEFDGSVTGLNYVGGLVGDNSGSILGCRVSGEISGKRFTGGIAGHNTGLVSDCVSYADVNTVIHEAQLDLESLNTVSSVPLALLSAEDENIVSDSGGIVGYSGGVLLGCVNHGTVGYQHYGYNVGGIAGRQAGFLSGCENYGSVLGRKDVAGIVGQMEPYLLLTDTTSLADELILLNSYMNAASNDLAEMGAQMRGALDGTEVELAPVDTAEYPGSISQADAPLSTGGTISGGSGSSGGTISGGSGGSGSIIPGGSGGSGNSGGIISGGSGGSGSIIPGGSGVNLPGINTERASELADFLSGLSEQMSGVFGSMSDTAGTLAGDLRLANNQFSRVMLLMSNALSGNFNNRVFEDVSDELGEDELQGRVSGNLNLGTVEGDSNVGGVVGAMGIEYEFDLEDTLAEKLGANGIVNSTYNAECVCSGNVSRGAVTAKKDRVGGVVGSSEMGVLLKNEGYARVESSDGGYVGGIAGYSEVPIRFCYAMCDIAGSSYVGGIVGYGAAVSDCASMIEAEPADACLGAIAGWADMQNSGAVVRNVFVHDSLGAVDGISYRDLAMPVSYAELVALEGLPDEFRTLKLSFLADGEAVAHLAVDYGASLDPAEIPAVPEKPGLSGAWEPFSTENLRFSETIHAVYTPYQSAVASEVTREDSPQSIVLLEGSFAEGVSVSIEPYEAALDGEQVLEGWRVRLENADTLSPPQYRVRYLAPVLENRLHRVELQMLIGDVWMPVKTEAKGSYLSFPVKGDSVCFRAVEVSLLQPRTLVLFTAAGVSLAGLLVTVVNVSRRRKNRATQQEKSAE